MIRWAPFAISLSAIGLALLLGGRDPFGRVALSVGASTLAKHIFQDPEWTAVSAYRANDFETAAQVFAQTGPGSFYNLGNTHVHNGNYAAALEAYDAALAQNRQDAQANANYDLVAAFYAGTQIDPDAAIKWSEDKEGATVAADVAKGSARAAGTGDGVTNTGALVGLPEVESTGTRRVRKVFDDKFMIASPRWLATLEDVPGAYLSERIAHEHKRRVKAGIAQEPGEEQ